MSEAQSVGAVAELWRFPVKSMAGERLETAELTIGGLTGDRAYALLDVDTGKVVSAKSVRLFPGILNCRATFLEPPRAGAPAPPVAIDLPGGARVISGEAGADEALSGFFGRRVRLIDAAPETFTIDEHRADVEGADPSGHRDLTLPQKLGAALFAELGAPSPVSANALFDVFPMSVISTSTLRRLAQLAPDSRIDRRRFRMNIVVETAEPGFVENSWVGRDLVVGPGALNVTMLDPRCVMTTLPQGDLPEDLGVLRTLVQHNRLDVFPGRLYPCAGVYAVVASPGMLRIGDPVRS